MFLVVWSILVYVPLAHWIWGGGFLSNGVSSTSVAAWSSTPVPAFRPRFGFAIKKRVFADGEKEQPSNIPLIAIGLALLWFGWLGDNPAGALSANGVATQAFVNTFMAGGLAMGMWLIIDCVRTGKASMVGALTGVLAGLVAVTPCAGYVPTWAACFISLVAGADLLRRPPVPHEARLGRLAGRLGRARRRRPLRHPHGRLVRLGAVTAPAGCMDGNAKQFGLQLAAVGIMLTYTFAVTLASSR